eukprot:1151369-Rhodomonas_salina.4
MANVSPKLKKLNFVGENVKPLAWIVEKSKVAPKITVYCSVTDIFETSPVLGWPRRAKTVWARGCEFAGAILITERRAEYLRAVVDREKRAKHFHIVYLGL